MLPSKWEIWVAILQNYYMFAKPTTCTGLQAEQIFSVHI